MKKKVATVGSMHSCPLTSGTVPHVGGPVVEGEANVKINGIPVAVVGSTCTCAGPTDTVATGNPHVLVNGKPIASEGDMTAHGGTLLTGAKNVIISSVKPNSKREICQFELKELTFPKIRFIDRVGAAMKGKSNDLKQGKQNIDRLREKASRQEREKNIFNLQWRVDDDTVNDSLTQKKIYLTACVSGYNEGDKMILNIFKKGKDPDQDEQIETLTGHVADDKINVEWQISRDLFEHSELFEKDNDAVTLGTLYFTVTDA